MHAYYEKWKFKHPLPNDFRENAELFTGKKLGWFFEDIFQTTKKQDYAFCKIKENKLVVYNNAKLVVPFSISPMNGDSILETIWFEGFAGQKSISLSNFKNTVLPVNKYTIDANESTLELYKRNNSIRTKRNI